MTLAGPPELLDRPWTVLDEMILHIRALLFCGHF